MVLFLKDNPSEEAVNTVKLGLQHEQQHQELFYYDIKYILGNQPTFPAIQNSIKLSEITEASKWISIEEGVYEIGHKGDDFCFDNELGKHKAFIHGFEISTSLVSNKEFLEFINQDGADKYDLLKTAIAHHRFTWIHPFGNGNGRVVRLLTYALMIKYGFNVKDGKIINPTAVFCNNRDKYYEHLSEADLGTDESLLNWSDYVLSGILEEVTKVNKLLDFDFLYKNILVPTIKLGAERGYLNKAEAKVLNIGILKQSFKATELDEAFKGLTSRQKTHLIAKMKESGFIRPLKENGRTYCVSFMNNFLMRSLIQVLEKENFIPAIDS